MKIILFDLPAQDGQVSELNRRMEARRGQGTHEC